MRVENRALEEDRTIHVICEVLLESRHLSELLGANGLPEMVAVKIIRVRVMVVVSELPTTVREEQGAHADRANNLVDKATFGEALMSTVVANDE